METRKPSRYWMESQLDALLDKLSGCAKPGRAHSDPGALPSHEACQPGKSDNTLAEVANRLYDHSCQQRATGGLRHHRWLAGGSDGFPAAARESIMEEALLPPVEDFPDAEERRLMYVALAGHAIGY